MAGTPRLAIEDRGAIARVRAAFLAGAADLRVQQKVETRRVGRDALGTVRSSAQRTLPQRGGLAARVAGSRFTLQASPGRIRLKATHPFNLPGIDAGQVRHPTYGHGPVVVQRVLPGWFTRPARATEPVLRVRLTRVTEKVATTIRRSS